MNQKASLFLVAVAGIALVTTLFRPQTAWLARAQLDNVLMGSREMVNTITDLGVKREDMTLSWAFPKPQPGGAKAAFAKALADHPNDAELQIAGALHNVVVKERLPGLRALPPSAARDAVLLRYACLGESREISLDNRVVEQDKFTTNPETRKDKPVDPAGLARSLATAQEGAKLDPSNGFFPFMEATVLYGLRRDKEAEAALHHAALCPTFDDGIQAELDGTQRLRELALGPQLGIIELSIAAATLFPHYATLRSTARLVSVHAREREQAGDTAGGMVLRRDLITVGEKLRDSASPYIGNLVGTAIVAIGTGRVQGAPQPDEKAIPEGDKRYELKLAFWEKYATEHGAADLAQRARKNTTLKVQNKAVWDRTLDVSTFGPTRLLKLFFNHFLTLNTLVVLVIVLGLGGIAGVVVWRMPAPSLSYSLVAWILALTFCPLLLPIALWKLWHAASPSQRLPALLAAWLVPGVLMGLLFLLEAKAVAPWLNFIGLIQGLSAGEDSPREWQETLPQVGLLSGGTLLLLLLPALWMAILALWSGVRQQALSVGVLRGLAGSALPVAALLCLGYVGLVTRLAAREAEFKAELREQARSEVAYFTRLTHP